MKYLCRILKSSVAVEQRVCIRIVRYCFVKSLVDQSSIIGVSYDRRNNPAVAQIKNSTEIDLVYYWTNILLELGHICQPFLIGPVRMTVTVENVFRRMLWV